MSAVLYINEYSDVVNGDVPVVPPIAQQEIDFSSFNSVQSAAFNAATTYIELVPAGSHGCVAFGSNPTATASSLYLAAESRRMFRVAPSSGLKLAVIIPNI